MKKDLNTFLQKFKDDFNLILKYPSKKRDNNREKFKTFHRKI